jgi:hypothetical protein
MTRSITQLLKSLRSENAALKTKLKLCKGVDKAAGEAAGGELAEAKKEIARLNSMLAGSSLAKQTTPYFCPPEISSNTDWAKLAAKKIKAKDYWGQGPSQGKWDQLEITPTYW